MPKPLNQLTDEELILEFQHGNEAAFTLLVGRFKDALTNYVFRFLGDMDEADETVQETFIRVFRSRQSYRPVAKFSTWIYTIAANLARSRLRRRRVRQFFSLQRHSDEEPVFDLPDDSPLPDEAADAALAEERIQKALDTLPRKFREIVVLRDVQELSYEEIAAITGLNMGTVKSRLNRARAELHELLKDIREG